MLNDREVSAAIGSTAYDADGDKIGTVEHFFVDDRTGAPTWVAVATGLFGTRHSIVPAADAGFADGVLRLPVHKDAVKSAPDVPDSAHLDAAVEDQLRRHYGLPTTGATDLPPGAQPPGSRPPGSRPPEHGGRHAALDAEGGRPEGWSATDTSEVPVGAVGAASAEPPGPVPISDAEVAAARAPTTPDDGSMVRSEEQLRVSTERVAAGRVRLVKYVVTEEVQVTVPIRREEVRLEELPVDAPAGHHAEESLLPAGTEAGGGLPDEIVLHAERPVVSVEVVPVERVRVRTETVTGQEQVSDRVQRERIVVDES